MDAIVKHTTKEDVLIDDTVTEEAATKDAVAEFATKDGVTEDTTEEDNTLECCVTTVARWPGFGEALRGLLALW
jgi:hypothetical protein